MFFIVIDTIFVLLYKKMEEIQNVIAEIETKIAKMRASLRTVRTENEDLKSEIQTLTNNLSQKQNELEDFMSKYNNVKNQLEQGLIGTSKKDDYSSQIDELVREIDDCISRLKVE